MFFIWIKSRREGIHPYCHICIPSADEVSFVDEPDPGRGVGLPLHPHRLLGLRRPRLPGVSPVSNGANDDLGDGMVIEELDQPPRGVVLGHDDLARLNHQKKRRGRS